MIFSHLLFKFVSTTKRNKKIENYLSALGESTSKWILEVWKEYKFVNARHIDSFKLLETQYSMH